MSDLPLQPLVWSVDKISSSVLESAKSPIHGYFITKTEKTDKFAVGYYRNGGKGTDYATGFATIDEAKAWAWNHYNEKMQPYINNTQTWIDARKQLPQVDKDTQFICAYDSAIEPYVRVTTFSVEMGDFGLDHADVLAWMPIPEFSTMQNLHKTIV